MSTFFALLAALIAERKMTDLARPFLNFPASSFLFRADSQRCVSFFFRDEY